MSTQTIETIQTKDDCYKSIDALFEKYENNIYMLKRLYNHVLKYLPQTLENELKTYEKRIHRNTHLTNEKQLFEQVFLEQYKYYYLANINCFYEYNGEHYNIVKKDNIIHTLLATISEDRTLLDWKYKTKTNILKQIKERSLFTTIPESCTIQNVLNVIYPFLFKSKNEAKHFLTIVGDNILKKNQELIYFTNSSIRQILNELDNVSNLTIGYGNIFNNFISKYHENHSYENCRLIKMNEHCSYEMWKEILQKVGLDLLCVAVHYSNRYGNADNYIHTKADEDLKTYVFYLKNSTTEKIVSKFMDERFNFVSTTNDIKIYWRNIHFIWKQYCSDMCFPNMIYSSILKNMIKQLNPQNYNEEQDCLMNCVSRYLPIESDFIHFWENNMTSCNINDVEEIATTSWDELEIEEISMLYKQWVKIQLQLQTQTNPNPNPNPNYYKILSTKNISEENILKILRHFFPNTIILDDKYVIGIHCILWNKPMDILNSFHFIKQQIEQIEGKKEEANHYVISLSDAYNYYVKYVNANSNTNTNANSNTNANATNQKCIVSKLYFEKYLKMKIPEYIVHEHFIDTNCFSIINENKNE